MKIRFLRARTAIIAGIICIVTTATVAAATNGLFLTSTTDRNNAIKTFPSSDKVKSTVGFLPKYVENFEGGFKFESFNYADTSLTKDDGTSVTKSKESTFEYKRDGQKKGQYLFMNAMPLDKKYFDESIKNMKDITEYKGVKIYYNTVHRKDVPENYVKTEEDLKQIKNGTLAINVGTDKVEEYTNQSVDWYEGGIHYNITNSSYDDVSRDAMIGMAKNVINK